MLREHLLEMALAVAVGMLEAKSSDATSPAAMALRSIVDKMPSERDIALIKYCFQHPNSK